MQTATLLGRAVRWGIVIGALDILSAIGFWQVYRNVGPARIFQSVAAGIEGQAAFTGGAASAWFGAALHFAMACAIAGVFAAVAARWPRLMRTPWVTGALAGLIVYAVMNLVVLPLSNATPPRFNAAWVIYSIGFSHIVCVGIVLALLARREISPPADSSSLDRSAAAPSEPA